MAKKRREKTSRGERERDIYDRNIVTGEKKFRRDKSDDDVNDDEERKRENADSTRV